MNARLESAKEQTRNELEKLDATNAAQDLLESIHVATLAGLNGLCRTVNRQFGEGARCAFYMVNRDGTGLHHLIGMPESYATCVDNFLIGAESLGCGLAAHLGTPIISADVTKDPRWESWRWLAAEHDYRGCWSFPIATLTHKIVGTMALYFTQPREPVASDYELIAVYTQAAGIVLTQHLEAEERSFSEAAALRASEAKYRSLFETMSEGFCIIEKISADDEPPEFRWTEVNPAFERHSGGASLIGKTLGATFPRRADTAELYDAVLRTRQPARFELTTTQGSVLDLHAFPMRDECERKLAVLFQDVTERKRTERRQAFSLKLSDALRPLEGAAEIEGQAMRVLTEHLEIARAQYYAADSSGDFVDSLGGHTNSVPLTLQRFRLDDFGSHIAQSCRAGQNVVVSDVESDARLSASERLLYKPLAVRAFVGVPLIKNGKFIGLISANHDRPRAWSDEDVASIEETLQRTWAALERANAEAALRESDRRKDEYLAMLGHELRNPLGAIRNASELLMRADSDDSRVRRAASVLHRQSIHMSRIIDGLLDVSRIARGKITLELAPLDLRRVVDGVLDLRKFEIESRGLELYSELAPEPIWVVGDEARLVQVVDNLVGNSIKFTHAGGSIAVSLRKDAARALISVRDTGIGIRPEILPAIFEPFRQDTQDALRTSDGLGLGLSLAQGLVELHQGSIEALSPGPGKGTELLVRLPLAAAPSAANESEIVDDAQALRILVVEDNGDAAEMLSLLLQGFGHQVSVAETGGEALELLEAQRFDIGLCDLGLPDMSGHALARSIREHPVQHDLTLVALTGYGQPEDRRQSAKAGFNEHLTKPVNLDALKSVLRNVQLSH